MPAGCFTPTPLSRLETSIEQREIIEVAENIFTEEDFYGGPTEVVVTKRDKRYKKDDPFRMIKVNKNNTILYIHFPDRFIDIHKKGYEGKIKNFIEAYKEKFGEEYSIS